LLFLMIGFDLGLAQAHHPELDKLGMENGWMNGWMDVSFVMAGMQYCGLDFMATHLNSQVSIH